MASRFSLLLLPLVLCACGDDSAFDAGNEPPDAAQDGPSVDTLTADGGADGSVTDDAGPTDAASDAGDDAQSPADGGADVGEDDGGLDVGPPDVGVDAGPLTPTRCDEFAGAYFCDGFESEGAWDRYTLTEASTSPLYRGMFSRRANFPDGVEFNGNATVLLIPEPVIPAPATFYLRAYVRIDGGLSHRSLALFRLVGTPSVYFLNIGDPSATRFYDGPGDGGSISGEPYPRGRWTCMQLSISGADVRLLVDGADLVRGTMNVAPTEYSFFSMGLIQLPGGGPVTSDITVSMDEVVLSDSPIPCD